MLLIDSVYIHNGGGKVLLDCLLSTLNDRNISYVHLKDDRNKTIDNCQDEVSIGRNRWRSRRKFYTRNRDRFRVVFCFGNVPPPAKISSLTITYFHQRLFLEEQKSISSSLKFLIIKCFKRRTDLWLVQTESMKSLLCKGLNINKNTIKILPFYPNLNLTSQVILSSTYLYVSSGAAHKNHFRLLEAFVQFSRYNPSCSLVLTIEESNSSLIELIGDLRTRGYNIQNNSNLSRKSIEELMGKCEFVIYPSLSESFGLGLIEACIAKKKILASDLPFVFDVCYPSDIFDPNSVESIYKCLVRSKNCQLEVAELRTNDEINKIIQLINE